MVAENRWRRTFGPGLVNCTVYPTMREVQPQDLQNEQTQQRKRVRKRARYTAEVALGDFSQLDGSHPYGVLPGGNQFLQACPERRDTIGQHPTQLLTDECWSAVFSYCGGVDLGRLVQTCRFFYVAGHQPELWRDVVLRRHKHLAIVGMSWKDTFMKNFDQVLQQGKNRDRNSSHRPMLVSGVYSDFLYRLHSCRSFAIPQQWYDSECGTVCRVRAADMTTDRFFNDFESQNKPVLVTGGASSWAASERWKDHNYLLQHTQGRSFRATSGTAPLPANFTLEAYLKYCKSEHLEEAPLYLFDRTALKPDSVLWKDYFPDMQQSCPYWDPVGCDRHDLFKVLGEGSRPDHTWLIVGPQRSGSVFHIDPNATHAWNATIQGRKFWIFYPPGVAPPGVHPSEDGDEVALPLSIGEWIFQFWDEHVERKRMSPPSQRPLECMTQPGDILFVPHGWWHFVVNLDEYNVAITHNYVGVSNLGNVFKFLSKKRDQVSGCRDRSESIKPEQLYEAFSEKMSAYSPVWTQEALAQTEWTCKAWKEDESRDNLRASKQDQVSPTEPESSSIMKRAKVEGSGGFSFSFL